MLFKKKMAEESEGVSFLDDMEEIEMVDTESNIPDVAEAGTQDETDFSGEETLSHDADLVASISRNTTVRGDIDTQDNIDIFGSVNGYVASNAVVKIYGTVMGDVKCATLVSSSGGRVTGNVVCVKAAVLGEGTMVEGNVTTGTASVCGKIKGNLVASEVVMLGANSSVIGDITTPEIEVSKGAVIYGSVVMERHEPAVAETPEAKPIKVTRSPIEQAETGDFATELSRIDFERREVAEQA